MTLEDAQIVVVGGGIIGLTSALALLEADCKHVRVIAASFDHTTSHGAGAVWMPFALPSHLSPHKILEWCTVAYAWLGKLHRTHGKDVGIHEVDGVEINMKTTPISTHPYWAHLVRNFRLLEEQEVRAILPDGAHGKGFTTFIYNPNDMMGWLTKRVQALGGVLEERHVSCFDELQCDLIINCTGIASKDLANDATVFPIRGQTVKVNNPSITQFRMVVEADGNHTYVLPRPSGEVVLGGTLQPNRYDTQNDEEDVRGIFERCSKLYPQLLTSSTKRLGAWAGLRPARRDGVRLEWDSRRARNGAQVIHNYGHAGSGHTLHWGCAQEVLAIAKQHFGSRNGVSSRL